MSKLSGRFLQILWPSDDLLNSQIVKGKSNVLHLIDLDLTEPRPIETNFEKK